MGAVPERTADDVRERLERIRDLAQHGLSADPLHKHDDRQWYRTLLRVFGDIREECVTGGRKLADEADAGHILSPSEISEAGRISRAALYKRREGR